MNWFDLLKVDFSPSDAMGFMEHLQDELGGDIDVVKRPPVSTVGEKKRKSPIRQEIHLNYDAGNVKLKQNKKGEFFIFTHNGSFNEEKKLGRPVYNLKKIVDELLEFLQNNETFEKFDIDGLDFSKATPEEQLSWFNSLKAGVAVTTANTPAIINVRYSKKKEDEEFGQED